MENERSTIRILNALTTFDLSQFDDRLRLQKLVFLARKLGHDLGYSYNWYARGPYSPSLTRILFSAHEQDQLVLEDFELNADERAVVKELGGLLKKDIDNPDALELLASVWYFIRRRPYTKKERNELIDSIVLLKPKFSKNDVEQAYDRIMDFRDS
jgi:hypothetical protein